MSQTATFPLIAKTFAGLEAVLATELRHLGAQHIQPLKRAVAFEGDQALLYQANLHLRTALRVLKPVHQFRAFDEAALYKGVRGFDWRPFLKLNQTFAIDSVVNSAVFRHSHYVALKTKDAIVDQFRAHFNRRPSINLDQPDLRIHVHINDRQVRLLLDSSGDSLNRRGYRRQQGPAPLNEVLAAGLLLLAEWKGERTFIDPMCGSGTLPIEAALIASEMAPGLLRREFGFQRWGDYDESLWKKLWQAARAARKPVQVPIMGMDQSAAALRIAHQHVRRARMEPLVQLQEASFTQLLPPAGGGLLIVNPPYGERLKVEDLSHLYRQIGDQFKQHYAGYDAWIFSANLEALKRVGLKADRKHLLYNGPLACRFQRYRMYKGRQEAPDKLGT